MECWCFPSVECSVSEYRDGTRSFCCAERRSAHRAPPACAPVCGRAAPLPLFLASFSRRASRSTGAASFLERHLRVAFSFLEFATPAQRCYREQKFAKSSLLPCSWFTKSPYHRMYARSNFNTSGGWNLSRPRGKKSSGRGPSLPWSYRLRQQFATQISPILVDALACRSYTARRRSFRSALQAPVIGQPQVISQNSDRSRSGRTPGHLPEQETTRWLQVP